MEHTNLNPLAAEPRRCEVTYPTSCTHVSDLQSRMRVSKSVQCKQIVMRDERTKKKKGLRMAPVRRLSCLHQLCSSGVRGMKALVVSMKGRMNGERG